MPVVSEKLWAVPQSTPKAIERETKKRLADHFELRKVLSFPVVEHVKTCSIWRKKMKWRKARKPSSSIQLRTLAPHIINVVSATSTSTTIPSASWLHLLQSQKYCLFSVLRLTFLYFYRGKYSLKKSFMGNLVGGGPSQEPVSHLGHIMVKK